MPRRSAPSWRAAAAPTARRCPPPSLATLDAGTHVVLPSPNGSTLSLATGDTPTFAGCLRNASAVAAAAARVGRTIAVIAAGERWPDGSLRPAVEDFVGAGSILVRLPGAPSPEARAAIAAWRDASGDVPSFLHSCASGRELGDVGFRHDADAAGEADVSAAVPRLAACPWRYVGAPDGA